MRGLSVRLPDFLIIGAMKAGTTSLYHDLLSNPQIFFPLDKEPGNLASDDVLTENGRRRYASILRAARSEHLCGEASTAYTKLPDIRGVPERARQVLGAQLKVIYIVREPVSRIISHHDHEQVYENMGADINQAVRESDQLINYSLYAMQIEPWLERLAPDRVQIIQFESYVEDRTGTLSSLCEYLGIAARPELVKPDDVFNPGNAKLAAAGLVWRMTKSRWYRKGVRPLLPMSLKSRLRSALLPKASPRPDPPTVETVDYIIDRVADDADRVAKLMGRSEPLWDFEAVRQRALLAADESSATRED